MKKKTTKSAYVMVTFGRGCAELKEQFDEMARRGGYTKAGLALKLIREGVEQHIKEQKKK